MLNWLFLLWINSVRLTSWIVYSMCGLWGDDDGGGKSRFSIGPGRR